MAEIMLVIGIGVVAAFVIICAAEVQGKVITLRSMGNQFTHDVEDGDLNWLVSGFRRRR